MREEITNLYELSDGWESVCRIDLPLLEQYDYLELNVIKHHLLSQAKHGLLYFTVIIKGHRVRAMLDSGATRDIIDAGLQRKLCLEAQ